MWRKSDVVCDEETNAVRLSSIVNCFPNVNLIVTRLSMSELTSNAKRIAPRYCHKPRQTVWGCPPERVENIG